MALIANTYHIHNCKLPFHVRIIIQYTIYMRVRCAHKHTQTKHSHGCAVYPYHFGAYAAKNKQYQQRYTTFYYIYVTFFFLLFHSPTHCYYCYYYFIGVSIGIYRWCVFRTRKSKPSFRSVFCSHWTISHFSLLFMWLTCYENKVNACKKIYIRIQFTFSHYLWIGLAAWCQRRNSLV